ncbi:hypothetical protein CIRG_07732 [Coccidioides immitis RMSCC 2394]|uniref:Uncharacterized protein n=1 Tax=Coccidioides immitis RMSCC 2394 TaxID=404692 RepID=A0A0J6YHA4_COCIT|nr:hypothetical protein CIRG_07732 [Coccidioides immitis RMSCC 2394]
MIPQAKPGNNWFRLPLLELQLHTYINSFVLQLSSPRGYDGEARMKRAIFGSWDTEYGPCHSATAGTVSRTRRISVQEEQNTQHRRMHSGESASALSEMHHFSSRLLHYMPVFATTFYSEFRQSPFETICLQNPI